jgi:hypothetical protein
MAACNIKVHTIMAEMPLIQLNRQRRLHRILLLVQQPSGPFGKTKKES